MKHSFALDGENLLLRPLDRASIEPLRLLRNREENRIWFFHSDIISAEGQAAWFARYEQKEDDYMFAVYSKADPNLFLGSVALYDYDPTEKRYEVGRLLLDAKKVPRHGLGVELIGLALRIGFEKLGAKKIVAEVWENNARSLRCCTENGFSVVGRREEQGRPILQLERCRI